MDNEKKWIEGLKTWKQRFYAEKIITKYYKEIYSYVYRQIGNIDDSMDITQDVFGNFWKTVDKYDESKSGLRTWLYHIATNLLIDFRRKNKVLFVDIEEIEIPAEIDHIKQMEDRALLNAIDAFVSQQDEVSEKIFRMRLYNNIAYSEIADVLGINEDNARKKYQRIIDKIREEFKDER